jgi:hypothetical protein
MEQLPRRTRQSSTDLQEEGERLMSEKPYTVQNWKRVCSGVVASGLLLAGSAGAYDFDDIADPYVGLDGYGGRDYDRSPDLGYGGLGLLDPGYAFSAYDVYGYPGSGVRDYGAAGGYGYPYHGYSGYGYPGFSTGYGAPYGYGPVTRSYALPANTGVPGSAAEAADRAYIRQLEQRIRKLENANKQSLPAYGERSSSPSPVWPSSNGTRSAYQAPATGQFGKPNYPGAGSSRGSHPEYPVFQPSYGGPPTYKFRQ